MWDSIIRCFTPTVLAGLLNLMIAIIAFITKFSAKKRCQNRQQAEPDVAISSSFFHRFQSINFHPQKPSDPTQDSDTSSNVGTTRSRYFFQQQNRETSQANHLLEESPEQTHAHFTPDRKVSILDDFQHGHVEKVEENEPQSMEEVYSELTGSHFSRKKTYSEPVSIDVLAKLPEKMRKSTTFKSAFFHFEDKEMMEAPRPETVRERGNARETEVEEDKEVDAKADDFIKRFKQQLMLQRLDSINRYKKMIEMEKGGW